MVMNMIYKNKYNTWLRNVSETEKAELLAISDDDIKDRFYKDLEFGTGGLRGVIGVGTNRMNSYVVARTTKALADYIKEMCGDTSTGSVVIGYDSRNFSEIFAKIAASVLSGCGIKTYLFDELRPTPEVSFAIRYKKATAGIVITASHNPAKYNGYKVYWSDGGQIPPDIAREIYRKIQCIDFFDLGVEPNSDLIEIIGQDVDDAYIKSVYMQSVNPLIAKKDFKIVYTPLHGSGNKLVRSILKRSGFENVIVVKEQELPNGDFPTVESPNPENKECFEYAINLAKEHGVDLIIGTDPDCDRMGIVVRNKKNEYVTMSGNQVGIMLLEYTLASGKLPQRAAAVTTIVSTKMADVVCDKYGVKLFRTLTGFKFIGEKIYEFEKANNYNFVFGFEESYGYLKGTYARDKDAVVASMLIAEMAVYYAQQYLTLYEVMQNLYNKYGGYYEDLECITFEGIEGVKKIEYIMKQFRKNNTKKIGEYKVYELIDYLKDTELPKADVLYFKLNNGVDFVIRPSGTEPKIKIYYLAKATTYDEAKASSESVKKVVTELLQS